jgi:hypothetical protein
MNNYIIKTLNFIVGFIFGIIAFIIINKNYYQHAPDSSIVRKKIFKNGEDTYMLEPIICICPSSYRQKK